jgi:hypothetical protein
MSKKRKSSGRSFLHMVTRSYNGSSTRTRPREEKKLILHLGKPPVMAPAPALVVNAKPKAPPLAAFIKRKVTV